MTSPQYKYKTPQEIADKFNTLNLPSLEEKPVVVDNNAFIMFPLEEPTWQQLDRLTWELRTLGVIGMSDSLSVEQSMPSSYDGANKKFFRPYLTEGFINKEQLFTLKDADEARKELLGRSAFEQEQVQLDHSRADLIASIKSLIKIPGNIKPFVAYPASEPKVAFRLGAAAGPNVFNESNTMRTLEKLEAQLKTKGFMKPKGHVEKVRNGDALSGSRDKPYFFIPNKYLGTTVATNLWDGEKERFPPKETGEWVDKTRRKTSQSSDEVNAETIKAVLESLKKDSGTKLAAIAELLDEPNPQLIPKAVKDLEYEHKRREETQKSFSEMIQALGTNERGINS